MTKNASLLDTKVLNLNKISLFPLYRREGKLETLEIYNQNFIKPDRAFSVSSK